MSGEELEPLNTDSVMKTASCEVTIATSPSLPSFPWSGPGLVNSLQLNQSGAVVAASTGVGPGIPSFG